MKMDLYSLLFLVLLSLVVAIQKNTIDSSLETCGKWTRVPGTSTKFSDFQPHIYSEHTCLLTCMGHPSCIAADFDPKADRFDGVKPSCHLHYAASDVRLMPVDKGNKYWTFDRKEKCQVECMFAFAAVSDRCAASKGELFENASDTWTCRKECISDPKCVGYDWFEKRARGRQCVLVFTPGDLSPKLNAFHYKFSKKMRSRCNATEPILGELEPDGSNTRIDFGKKNEHLLSNDPLWMKIMIAVIIASAIVPLCCGILYKLKYQEDGHPKPEGERKALMSS